MRKTPERSMHPRAQKAKKPGKVEKKEGKEK